MRRALAGSITVLGACTFATSAYSQGIAATAAPYLPAGGAVSVAIDPPNLATLDVRPVDFDLADLDLAVVPAQQLERSTGGDTPLAALDTNQYQLTDQDQQEALPSPEPLTGPPAIDEYPRQWSDHIPGAYSTHPGFFKKAGTITTELLILTAYFGAQSGKKLFRETTSFHFHDEGWFSKNTTNLGVDKLTHAFDTYLIAEILHMRMHKTTNASSGDALTAAIIASGFMALNEISDGIETDSGYSMQDITANILGAAFSVFRNTVPGVRDTVAFKIEIVPNDSVYSYRGQQHYEQQRYMLSFKGSGIEAFDKTPLKYLDLQFGYYASDFMAKDRNAGRSPKQRVFVGVGLNLGEIFFGRSTSKIGKAAYTVLDYFQAPYTSIRYDTTGHVGYSDL